MFTVIRDCSVDISAHISQSTWVRRTVTELIQSYDTEQTADMKYTAECGNLPTAGNLCPLALLHSSRKQCRKKLHSETKAYNY